MAQLSFKGKAFVDNYHLTVPYHPLTPQPKKSVLGKGKDAAPSLHDNVVIHGDNLKALKALLPTHAGKVKCIYIDPPYNTGNEHWVYNDKVNSPMMAEWLGKEVGRDDLTRHDKWLCMMTPRLKLLRELLREDGVIFISIDDNEVHHLRMLMDEIFGEENFVGVFVWRKKEGGGQAETNFVTEHEYIVVYANTSLFVWEDDEIPFDEAAFKKEDARGRYTLVKLAKWGNTARREDRPKMYFAVKGPQGKNVFPVAPDGNEGRWRVGKKRMDALLTEGLIEWQEKAGQYTLYEKVYFNGDAVRVVKERSILFDLANTGDGTNELTTIFGKKDLFENPKPSTLLKHLMSHVTREDDIILDSFAGSGTTAHAVLALNKADGGNRKFILVECEDYADKITAERVRRVIKGVPAAKDEALKKGLGGTFSYFELGEHPIDAEHLLSGKSLPAWRELARFAFYTATGESYDAKLSKEKDWYVGTSKEYDVFLVYKPDVAFLKSTALDTTRADAIAKLGRKGKKKLVFAPMKYVSDEYLKERGIVFAQLPFELYR